MATPTGRIVTVGDVADVTQRQGPVQINHVERQRTVSVETTLPDGIALEEAMRRIEEQIVTPLRQQGQIGGLYDVRLSGTADDLTRLKNEMFGGFNVAVILTFLLLAALFQSYVYPFVVMLTVPLGAAGGILGLRVIQIFDSTQQLDVLTMLGFVILVGTVVNNSILLVYHALDRMREGVDPREAVKDAVRVRVRPIFMTTGTTVCGMLPLVVMPGAKPVMFFSILAVAERGTEVVCPDPGFPIYASMTRFAGAKPVSMRMASEKGYHPDLDDLASRINDRTRLLILNSPHNPTGSAMTRKEVEAVAEMVLKHKDLWVLTDEVYKELLYSGEFFSITSIPGMAERTILLDGFSKSYAMTG